MGDPARPAGNARRVILALSLAALAVQLLGVYLPGSALPDEAGIPGADKVVHALIFGVPAYLFGRLVRRGWQVALVGLVFLAHAALSEWLQGFVPFRDPDVFDFLADAAGVALALLALWLGRRKVR